MFQHKKDFCQYRLGLLSRLIRIAEKEEERPSWIGTNYKDGWRVLIENLSMIMGEWNAWDGCNHKHFDKLWDQDPIALLMSAVARLNDNQQELFAEFVKSNRVT